MNSKKWIKIWFFVVLLVPVVGAFNYLIDPYGLNNFLDQERINQFKKRNTGYATRLKTKRLREGKFDTIMLGASKIGVMDPTVVDEYTKGNTYNLSAPASTTEQQYEMFMYAMEYNQIDTLIYGIDFSSFNQSLTLKDDYKEYYDLRGKVVNKQKISNYDLYFNLKTLKDSFYALWKNFLGEEIAEQRFLYENGMQDFLRRIFLSKNKKFDVKKAIDNKITVLLHPDKGLYKNYSFSPKYLEYFRKIIEYCQKHNIKVIVYISPDHSDHFDALSSAGYFNDYELFKKELVKIVDYVDFSGHNSVTENTDYYWDSVHLKKDSTKLLMARLFNDKSINIPDNFGIFVTKDTIDEHLDNLRKQIREYDLNLNR